MLCEYCTAKGLSGVVAYWQYQNFIGIK